MVAAAEQPQEESPGLDQALVALRRDMTNPTSQSKFYDIFLNTTFCVPTLDPKELESEAAAGNGDVLPLIVESEGNDYLLLFDTEERLRNWAGGDAHWVGVPGHVLAAATMPPLHMAMNIGTDYSKEFHPEEIAWLRDVVERCDRAAQAQAS